MNEFNKAAREGKLPDAIGGGKITKAFPLFKRNLAVIHVTYGDSVCLWYMKADEFVKNARGLMAEKK